ncbi:unnamed protein product [Bursaphelenchus okinawaensis]|uniref:Cwf15/Cwc15 cell cycle control protein n=1 Tax=Bursaphelenchus okinawaensis TaxID=465554 RepID=A0A811L6S5_9BILA|nr:unnamed protein product [Bursaphelenchus okinawaensis]CAG9116877.1 unnamed protein product [Bursaphelenchus okinawaensis]
MTTAHRPTFDPARGGTGRNEGDLSKLSTQYSSKDLPSHKKLKYREPQIVDEHRSKDLRRVLEERESKSKDKGSSSSVPEKKLRLEAADVNPDKDDPLDDVDIDDSDEDSDDDEALMAELEAIKKERAAEKAAKEAKEAAEQERVRRENLLQGNPLLQPQQQSAEFKVKRRWDDDVVFKNCAKGTDQKKPANFINDSIRSEFHRKFMEKYIK